MVTVCWWVRRAKGRERLWKGSYDDAFSAFGLVARVCAGRPVASQAAVSADLVQERANPLAPIISVPFQLNYVDKLGANGQGS